MGGGEGETREVAPDDVGGNRGEGGKKRERVVVGRGWGTGGTQSDRWRGRRRCGPTRRRRSRRRRRRMRGGRHGRTRGGCAHGVGGEGRLSRPAGIAVIAGERGGAGGPRVTGGPVGATGGPVGTTGRPVRPCAPRGRGGGRRRVRGGKAGTGRVGYRAALVALHPRTAAWAVRGASGCAHRVGELRPPVSPHDTALPPHLRALFVPAMAEIPAMVEAIEVVCRWRGRSGGGRRRGRGGGRLPRTQLALERGNLGLEPIHFALPWGGGGGGHTCGGKGRKGRGPKGWEVGGKKRNEGLERPR